MKKQKVFIRLANIVVTILSVMFILVYGNNENLAEVSPSIYVTDIKINPQNTNELYAGIRGNGLYRSADKGETWIRCGVEIESFNTGIAKIAFDPIEKNVYVGTPNGLFTRHADRNWVKLEGFDDVSKIFIQPTDQSRVIYVDASSGLYVSTVEGGWRRRGRPVELRTVNSILYPVAIDPSVPGNIVYFALIDNTIIAITGDDPVVNVGNNISGIYKSNNHEMTLEKILSTSSGILLISSKDANVMYGVNRNIILKSIDGGASWKEISKFGNNNNKVVDILVMDPVDHNILYSKISDYGTVYRQPFLFKSIDGGKTWQEITSASSFMSSVNNITLDPLNQDILYIGTSGKGIFKSTDAGKTWKAINKGIELSKNN